MPGTRAFCQDDGAGIHNIVQLLLQIHPDDTQPILRQGLKCRSQSVQSLRKRLIAGQLGKPFQQMVLGIVIDRLLLESPLTDAPQVYRYTLLICELGTEIVALTLHYRFNCATIVADSAIECYEICLPHTYILYSFALFFYPFLLLLTLDSHYI